MGEARAMSLRVARRNFPVLLSFDLVDRPEIQAADAAQAYYGGLMPFPNPEIEGMVIGVVEIAGETIFEFLRRLDEACGTVEGPQRLRDFDRRSPERTLVPEMSEKLELNLIGMARTFKLGPDPVVRQIETAGEPASRVALAEDSRPAQLP